MADSGSPEVRGRGQDPPLLLELSEIALGDRIHLRFNRGDDDVYVVAVPPGDYRVTALVIGRRPLDVGESGQRQSVTLARPLNGSFCVEPGKVYYIGDYVARLTVDTDFHVVVIQTKRRWDLQSATLRFDQTTADLREKTPIFRGVELAPAWR
jgi:hypothetical protein